MKKFLFLIILATMFSCSKDAHQNSFGSKAGYSYSQEVSFEDLQREILAQSFKSFLFDNLDFQNVLKDIMSGGDYEEFIPFLELRSLEYNGKLVAEWLSDFCPDSSKSIEFFLDSVFMNDPYLALFIKTDLEDDEDDMAEEWDTGLPIHVAFSLTNNKAHYYEIAEELNNYIVWSEEVPEGNYLFFGDFKNYGYTIITDDYLTVDGGNPFEEAHNFLYQFHQNNPFSEECQEAKNNLQTFLSNHPNPQQLNDRFAWIISIAYLQTIIELLCDVFPAIAGNGGTIHENCDRNNRNNREQLTQMRIPQKNDRSGSVLRRWDRGLWNSNGYFFEVVETRIINPNAPGFARLEKVFTANKRDLSRGKIMELDEIFFSRWRLDEYSHKAKFVWVARSNIGNQTSTITTNLGGMHKWEDDGIQTSLNLGGSLSIQKTLTNGSIGAGEDILYYCDPANGTGHEYNSGMIRFWIKES